jgi:protein arginine kinase activator
MDSRVMKCERCGREATVHLSERVDEARHEAHLCGKCARRAGIEAPEAPGTPLLESLVDQLITRHVGELVGELSRTSCSLCGVTFMEFRVDGQLGCPHDYEAFAKGLPPLLWKAHGATRHVGKVPRHAGLRPVGTGLKTRSELRKAIALEDYEQAARLRDRLRQEEDHAS